jgi:hypothetical protein
MRHARSFSFHLCSISLNGTTIFSKHVNKNVKKDIFRGETDALLFHKQYTDITIRFC